MNIFRSLWNSFWTSGFRGVYWTLWAYYYRLRRPRSSGPTDVIIETGVNEEVFFPKVSTARRLFNLFMISVTRGEHAVPVELASDHLRRVCPDDISSDDAAEMFPDVLTEACSQASLKRNESLMGYAFTCTCRKRVTLVWECAGPEGPVVFNTTTPFRFRMRQPLLWLAGWRYKPTTASPA